MLGISKHTWVMPFQFTTTHYVLSWRLSMRCKKKANYIFQGFMAVLSRSAGCFFCIKTKERNIEYVFNNLLSNCFSFSFWWLQKVAKEFWFSRCFPYPNTSLKKIPSCFITRVIQQFPMQWDEVRQYCFKRLLHSVRNAFAQHCENRLRAMNVYCNWKCYPIL
jgi:hypothetical protein